MTEVRDALGEWFALLNQLPRGTAIDIAEEGASPGAGAESVAAILIDPNGRAHALAIHAGHYDGEPRVFARVFQGDPDDVTRQMNAWKAEVSH
jgi:hypothetical protein